jgi:hypothetical protein
MVETGASNARNPPAAHKTVWHLTCNSFGADWCWKPHRSSLSLNEPSAEGMMLSHCANSRCSRPFLRLRQGKLFLVETEFVANVRELTAPSSPRMRLQPRRVERYWLCDECAAVWTLVHDRKQGIVLMPLSRPPVGARIAVAEVYREMA